MYDYNFFESYKIKKKRTQPGTGIMMAGFFATVVILGGVSAYTYYINAGIKEEIQTLENELNKPANVELVKRIADKREVLNNITVMATGLQLSDEALRVSDPINAELFEIIALALPADAQIDSMSVNEDSVSMSGVAAQRSAIAEFQKTLRESDVIQDVYVSNISSITSVTTETTETLDENDEVEYTFSLVIEFGGVEDEDNN